MKKIYPLLFLMFASALALQAQFNFSVTNIRCFGECTGSATITGPVNDIYKWSNGDSTQNINNLCAGSYTCTVSDSVSQPLDTLVITVTQPTSAMAATVTVTNAICNSSNGSVTIVVTGGTVPYSFLWSNSVTTADVQNLAAGTYFVSITDANGCTLTDSAIITGGPDSLHVQDSTITPSTCNCNGSAIVSITGAQYPVTYFWSDGDTGVSAQFSPALIR